MAQRYIHDSTVALAGGVGDWRLRVMEQDGMLRHLAFFEELGRMEETDASWRSVSAGLVVMRLVDAWIADGPTASRVDSWGVSAVREAIAQIAETTPVKRILTSVVDVMTSSTAVDMHALCPRLMAYGQALEYEAKWGLAADVYATIVAHAHPVEDSDLAVAGHLQLAFCLRTLGHLDEAAVAYADASRVAVSADDMIGILRAQLGQARISIAKGNLPYAEDILDRAISDASAPELQDIRSRALHDRAHVAGLRGQYERAIQIAYQALELSTTSRHRDRLLHDIASGFTSLGLLDVARDAYLVLTATAEEQYIRWLSEINLIEIAARQNAELHFDRYRRNLREADLTPQMTVLYLLHVGRGYHLLGHAEEGVAYLERAIALAGQYRFNQLLFEAEEALARLRRPATKVSATQTDQATPESLREVARVIRNMKELAGVS